MNTASESSRAAALRTLIIPAAGAGSRLNAAVPKALVSVNGRSMLARLFQLYRDYVTHIVVVARPSSRAAIEAETRSHAPRAVAVEVIEQPEPTGMLDAILLASPAVARHGGDSVWVTWADQVAVLPATVTRLAEVTASGAPPALALPTVRSRHPYTHFVRDDGGRIVRFLQRREHDRMPDEGESDMGLFALTRETFDHELQAYGRDVPRGAETGERNFVPFVPWLAARRAVITFPCTDPHEAIGINTVEDLDRVEAFLRDREPLTP